ncbi:MAG: hypothetical protein EBW65_11345 [Gammaproteobacteria bacterium]|nr:hypothetical protein [Gammaproteobacteria bacterium]
MTRNQHHGGLKMDDINTTLLIAALEAEGIVEPIDDTDCHPLDWMEVVGVDLFDECWTPEEAY